MKEGLESCPRPDLLVALEEGVLPESLAAGVRSHLERCELCARLKEDLADPAFAEPTLAEVAEMRKRVLEGPRSARGIPWRWVSVAAAAVVLSVGVTYWQSRQLTSLPAARQSISQKETPVQTPQYRLALVPAPLRLPFAAVVIRGSEASVPPQYLGQLGRALDPYRAGNFEEAARQLAALGREYPKAVEPRFYEGVAQLMRNETAPALAALEAAHKIGGEALNDDILWYLAVAQERSGNWDGARELLGKLCAAEGVHRQEACAALRKPARP